MKAWSAKQLGAPREVLRQSNISLPTAGPGELRIEVATAALGLPDVLMCLGSYEYKPELPFTPGQEVAGTVLEVGEGVSCAVGERVMGVTAFFSGNGGFAEQCMSMEGMVYPVPDAMPDDDAACFIIPYHTAWSALVSRGQLAAGETLLVLGAAGGSGSAAVQLGKALGAKVIAVAGGAEKVKQCRRFGADEVVDHSSCNFADEVNRLTGAAGADLIFDPVGGPTCEAATSCIAVGGRLLAVGFASGQWGEPSGHQLVMKNASYMGVFVGAFTAEQRLQMHSELLALYQLGTIKPLIEHRASFDDIPACLEAIEARQISGKVVACIR